MRRGSRGSAVSVRTSPPGGPIGRQSCAAPGSAKKKAKRNVATRRMGSTGFIVLSCAKTGNPDRKKKRAPCRGRHGARSKRFRLVSGALRHPDDVDAAVLRTGTFLPARGTHRDAMGVNALASEVLHGIVAALLSEPGRPAFLWVSITDDYYRRAGIALQAQSNVVEDALADVVNARAACGAEGALVELAGLRRRRRHGDAHRGGAVRGTPAA